MSGELLVKEQNLSSLKVQLNKELAKRGLTVSVNKNDLIARLEDYLISQDGKDCDAELTSVARCKLAKSVAQREESQEIDLTDEEEAYCKECNKLETEMMEVKLELAMLWVIVNQMKVKSCNGDMQEGEHSSGSKPNVNELLEENSKLEDEIDNLKAKFKDVKSENEAITLMLDLEAEKFSRSMPKRICSNVSL